MILVETKHEGFREERVELPKWEVHAQSGEEYPRNPEKNGSFRTDSTYGQLSDDSFVAELPGYKEMFSIPDSETENILKSIWECRIDLAVRIKGPKDRKDHLRRMARIGEGKELALTKGKIEQPRLLSNTQPEGIDGSIRPDRRFEGSVKKEEESKNEDQISYASSTTRFNGSSAIRGCERSIENIQGELRDIGQSTTSLGSPEEHLAYYTSLQICQCNNCVLSGLQAWSCM